MYKIPEDVTNKYRFVMLVSLRAEQLQAGARARIESDHTKATQVAQQEVASGLVEPWDPEVAALEAESEDEETVEE